MSEMDIFFLGGKNYAPNGEAFYQLTSESNNMAALAIDYDFTTTFSSQYYGEWFKVVLEDYVLLSYAIINTPITGKCWSILPFMKLDRIQYMCSGQRTNENKVMDIFTYYPLFESTRTSDA